MLIPNPDYNNYKELLARLYQGAVFLFEPNALRLGMVQALNDALQQQLGQSPRTAQFDMDDAAFFQKIGVLRKRFYTEPHFLNYVGQILQDIQWDSTQTVFDPMRLRTIQHQGHQNPAAKAIYHTHRDTWYANPQCQITWWIPLHDVRLEETFEFYPQYFNKAVDNDSKLFDHDSWMQGGKQKKIGWQNKKTGYEAIYPSLQQNIDRSGFGVACPKGSLLLFSGQHLHATHRQETGKTRFSIDFRTVELEHFKSGIGPENVDNASTGSSIQHHIAVV